MSAFKKDIVDYCAFHANRRLVQQIMVSLWAGPCELQPRWLASKHQRSGLQYSSPAIDGEQTQQLLLIALYASSKFGGTSVLARPPASGNASLCEWIELNLCRFNEC